MRPSPDVLVDAMLADSVASYGSKVEVQGGGWNHLRVRALPAVHGRIGLCVLLHVPSDQLDRTHTLRIRLEGPGGRPVPLQPGSPLAQVEATIRAEEPVVDSPASEHIVPLAVNIDGLTIEHLGVHRFVITVDGVDAKTLSFVVLHESGDAP